MNHSVNHTGSETIDHDSYSAAPATVDRLNVLLADHRKREVQLTEQIQRVQADLTDLRSRVAAAARQLRRLRSRYTVVWGPDGQINNAEPLYELLARDACQIGQELLLSLPATPPRHQSSRVLP